MRIVSIKKSYWPEIAVIYKSGIDTKNATFEEFLPDWEDWDRAHLKTCRLAIVNKNNLAGFAALSSYSYREVYKGVAIVSIYVAETFRAQGVGFRLLNELIKCSEKAGIWTLEADIFPENKISIRLFQRCGFRIIGKREKIGQMNGFWRDVLLLERRSTVVK